MSNLGCVSLPAATGAAKAAVAATDAAEAEGWLLMADWTDFGGIKVGAGVVGGGGWKEGVELEEDEWLT